MFCKKLHYYNNYLKVVIFEKFSSFFILCFFIKLDNSNIK